MIDRISELDDLIDEYNDVHEQIDYRIGLEFQNIDMIKPFPDEILRVSGGQVEIICDWDRDREPKDTSVYPLRVWIHLFGSPLIDAITVKDLKTTIPKYAGTHYIEEYDGSPRWRYEPVEWAEKMASSKQRRDSFWVALEKLEEDFKIRDEKFRKIHEMCATIDLDCSLRIGLVPTERFQVAVNQLQQRAGYHSPRRTWKNVESSLE